MGRPRPGRRPAGGGPPPAASGAALRVLAESSDAVPVALALRLLARASLRASALLHQLPPTRALARAMATDAAATIFDKIVAKQIPSTPVYEDEHVYAFRDIAPVSQTHILVIPKVRGRLDQLQHATADDKAILGHLLWAAGHVAKLAGLGDGYRVVVNDGAKGCQTVYHLHLHVIGGEQLTWPPGVANQGAPKA